MNSNKKTTEESFIDLGLPSGRLWAAENEPGYHQFDEAVKTFGDMLPSAEAWKELFDQCSHKWDNDSKGYTLTGPNGNTLFLPAAGCRHRGSLHYVGGGGYYWSRTADGTRNARNLGFLSGSVYPQSSNNRYFGFSVRLCKPAGAQ